MVLDLRAIATRLSHAPNYSQTEEYASTVTWTSVGRSQVLVDNSMATTSDDGPCTATGVAVGVIDSSCFMIGPSGE